MNKLISVKEEIDKLLEVAPENRGDIWKMKYKKLCDMETKLREGKNAH